MMAKTLFNQMRQKISDAFMAVPVRVKIVGIILLPVLILGFSMTYWITTGLGDWLSYILTDVRVEAAMRAGSRSVIFVTILAAVLSIILSSFLTYILTRPLLSLRDTAQKVADGKLETRATVWSNDEIGEVAQSVNVMLDHLVDSQEDLARSNMRLEAMNRVERVADRNIEIHDMLYAILVEMVDFLEIKMAWIYLRDPELDRYHLASWINVPDELQEGLLERPENELCSCQQDFKTEELGSLTMVRRCQRLEQTQKNGSAPHITIPLEANDQRFGIMNLVSTKENYVPTEDDLDLLNSLGAQISEIVANAWLRLKLKEKEEARQTLLESLVKAQEGERARLGRELHDSAGQNLTSLLVRLKTIEKQSDTPNMQQSLHTMQDVVSQTIEEIRQISYRLRPAALDEFGLEAAIDTLVSEMSSGTGVSIKRNLNLADIQLSSELETVIYRIVQEGLTNVIRHAEATRVDLELVKEASALCLRIDDNGCGFDPNTLVEKGKHGMGLASIRERAEIVGGRLDVFSAPSEGTTIQVEIPLIDAFLPW
ncbi:MAG: HAMP domain-containing protein [Chloroflexi bacterium]|nr:MAG: HAMP domain-containing protein [Chloroflexota bacterium]MBL1195451.1 HAMP domain-containing protein [Chloroflexota bacterium]